MGTQLENSFLAGNELVPSMTKNTTSGDEKCIWFEARLIRVRFHDCGYFKSLTVFNFNGKKAERGLEGVWKESGRSLEGGRKEAWSWAIYLKRRYNHDYIFPFKQIHPGLRPDDLAEEDIDDDDDLDDDDSERALVINHRENEGTGHPEHEEEDEEDSSREDSA